MELHEALLVIQTRNEELGRQVELLTIRNEELEKQMKLIVQTCDVLKASVHKLEKRNTSHIKTQVNKGANIVNTF